MVISAKLNPPPLDERLVERPRVSRRLAEVVRSHPVVWVCATAGAGKTTAVLQSAELVDLPLCWLTVDRTDAAPGRLLIYLEAALARRLPAVEGVANAALAAGIAHAETAGLLAEATAEDPLLLVLDGLERLAHAPEALAVLEAFARYAPPGLRLVLVAREELELDFGQSASPWTVAVVGERDLALTPPEAAELLKRAGHIGIDPARAVEVTGGWVTGLLFEAWRSSFHVIGAGGEADPLHGYLASQILAQLEPDERRFLENTSLLDEVSAERAAALGEPGAGELLTRLRQRHLPVSWVPTGVTMRCHPRFREYLAERLRRRGDEELKGLQVAYGELLIAEGLYEEATEHFLASGHRGRALDAAERGIAGVVARLDVTVAERWLAALDLPELDSTVRLAIGELMLAITLEDFVRGGRVADRLAAIGERDPLARASPMAASVMAWCFWHLGRICDARAVIEIADTTPETDALRYLLTLVQGEDSAKEPAAPAISGGPLDALTMRVHYSRGQLAELAAEPASPWAAAVSAPYRIGALRALGRLEEALELYQSAGGASSWSVAWLHGVVGPDLMIDLRRVDDAVALIARGRELARGTGSVVFVLLNRLIEAKLELRLRHDPAAALAILDSLEASGHARSYGFIGEQLDTWRGLGLLMSSPEADARRPLEAAIRSMTAAGRILELPTAAVYLAEAHWRVGDEDAADAAADLALDAAHRQGSNHHLLTALTDFPAVLGRRLDAEASADSPWHEVGRALRGRGVPVTTRRAATVRLTEFGRMTLSVDGREVRPRIAKSFALLAYLTVAPGHQAQRVELLDALFDARADRSTRAYLRQTVHRLREVLPSGAELGFDGDLLRFGGQVALRSESIEFESLLTEAGRLQGPDRLGRLLQALAILGRGDYLPGLETEWINGRREGLRAKAADATLEAAQLSFAAGRYHEAEELAESVLAEDAFKETAWRLIMRLASATGDEDRVITAYRRCARALGDIGAQPSRSTQQLLAQLRR